MPGSSGASKVKYPIALPSEPVSKESTWSAEGCLGSNDCIAGCAFAADSVLVLDGAVDAVGVFVCPNPVYESVATMRDAEVETAKGLEMSHDRDMA